MPDRSLPLNRLKAAVFDWDNTLSLSRDALVFSVNQILPQYGLPDWQAVKEKRDRNLSFRDNFPRIFGEKADEAYEAYRKVYMQNAARLIKAPPMANEVLQKIKQSGAKIMIVSNKDRLLLEYELPLIYDKSLFDYIVCGHEAEKDKPHPEQLWYALRNFNIEISAESVWMIGDSPMDSMCALQAGAKAVRIGEPIWEASEDKNSSNILFVKDFEEFYGLLTESGGYA